MLGQTRSDWFGSAGPPVSTVAFSGRCLETTCAAAAAATTATDAATTGPISEPLPSAGSVTAALSRTASGTATVVAVVMVVVVAGPTVAVITTNSPLGCSAAAAPPPTVTNSSTAIAAAAAALTGNSRRLDVVCLICFLIWVLRGPALVGCGTILGCWLHSTVRAVGFFPNMVAAQRCALTVPPMSNNRDTDRAAMSGPEYNEINVQLRDRYVELDKARTAAVADGDADAERRTTREMLRVGDEFVTRNMGLAGAATRPVGRNKTAWTEDLLAAAVAALWQAFLRWEPESGPFSTWAHMFLKGATLREVNKTEHGMSYNDFVARKEVLSTERMLQETTGSVPSVQQIADETGLTAAQVARCRTPRPVSLQTPAFADSDSAAATIGSLIGDDDDASAGPKADWVPFLRRARSRVAEVVAELGADASDELVVDRSGLTSALVRWLRSWDSDDLDNPDLVIDTQDLTARLGAPPWPDSDDEEAWLGYLAAAVAPLTPREFYLVMRRTGLDGADKEAYIEIASTVGLGREMLRRRFNRAEKKLAAPLPQL